LSFPKFLKTLTCPKGFDSVNLQGLVNTTFQLSWLGKNIAVYNMSGKILKKRTSSKKDHCWLSFHEIDAQLSTGSPVANAPQTQWLKIGTPRKSHHILCSICRLIILEVLIIMSYTHLSSIVEVCWDLVLQWRSSESLQVHDGLQISFIFPQPLLDEDPFWW